MAIAKQADKLLILQDVGAGLMARLYNLFTFEKPNHLAPLEKLCAALIKKFPEYPENLEKISGWDVFQKKSLELVPILRDYYLTFFDIIEWRTATWTVLEDMAKNATDLQFASNHSLTCAFFDLVVQYIQLHIMIEKIPERKLLLTVYARAYHCIEANSEPNFSRIAQFVNEFNENPIRKLQAEFEPLARRIVDSLVPLQMMLFKWCDPKSIRDTKVFDLIEKIDDCNRLTMLDMHMELLSMENVKRWILFGFLVSPSELQREGALVVLQTALSDTWLVSVYRDQYLEIHTQYRELYGWYRLNKWVFNDDQNKDPIKLGVTAAVGNSGLVHGQHRTQLRWFLRQLTSMVQGNPGLAAPKFTMILAALACARAEVLWFFLHHNYFAQPNFVIPKNKSQFLIAQYEDPLISELIFFMDKLTALVSSPEVRSEVSSYHTELFCSVGIPLARQAFDVLSQSGKITATNRQTLDSLLEMIQGFTEYSLVQDPDYLESFRMVWFRIQHSLSMIQGGGLSPKLIKDVCLALNPIVMHSRQIDQQLQQLRQYGSLKILWFYNAHGHNAMPLLDKIFEASLTGSQGQPSHCIAFVRVLNSALENVHRSCPEEQKAIGMHAMRKAQNYIGQITAAIDNCIQVILQKEAQLTAQHSPYAVVARLQQNHGLDKQQPQRLAMPGFESEHEFKAFTAELRLARKIVSEICCAIRENPSVLVFDHEYCPHEFLLEKLLVCMKTLVRKTMVLEETTTGVTIEQPSNFLVKLRVIVAAYHLISQHIAMDIHAMVKQILLQEFSDPISAGGAGEALADTSALKPAGPVTGAVVSSSSGTIASAAGGRPGAGGDTCLTAIVKFYSQTLFGPRVLLSSNGVFYSDYAHAFLSRDFPNSLTGLSQRWLATERFTDSHELETVVALSGPSGCRYIERELLVSAAAQVSLIKDFMVKQGRPFWEQLESRYAEEKFWREMISRMLVADLSRVTTFMLSLGCMMRFRSDLQQALAVVSQRQTGPLFELLKEAHTRTTPLSLVDSFGEKNAARLSLQALEQLCADCGLVDATDTRFRSAVFKHMCGTSPNSAIFAFLPELFGCVFASDEFRPNNMQYLVAEDGYRSNAHLLADAAVALVTAYTVSTLSAPYLAALTSLAPSTDSVDGRGAHNRTGSIAVRETGASTGASVTSLESEKSALEYTKLCELLNKALVRNLQHLVRCVALAMLTVKPSGAVGEQQSNSHQHLVLPIIDTFVRATNGLVSHSFLEDFLPYAIVRHNFVTLSTMQIQKSNAASFDFEEVKRE